MPINIANNPDLLKYFGKTEGSTLEQIGNQLKTEADEDENLPGPYAGKGAEGLNNFVAEMNKLKRKDAGFTGLPFLPQFDLGLPSTYQPTVTEGLADLRAASEINRAKGEAINRGDIEELNEYIATNEQSMQHDQERRLNSVFDALSAGQYATTRLYDDVVNQDIDWGDALKNSAREAGDASNELINVFLPEFLEPDWSYKGRKRMDWKNVLENSGMEKDSRVVTGLGFAMDMIVDPLNLVPGAFIARQMGKGARAGLKATGPLGEGFNMVFRPQAAIQDLGEGGLDYLRKRDYAEAGIQRKYHDLVGQVDEITGKMSPDELIAWGLWYDQPTKLKQEIRKLVSKGVIPESRLADMDGTITAIGKFTRNLFDEEVSMGLLNKRALRDNYMPGYFAFDPAARKGQAKFSAKETIPTGTEKVGFAQKRKTLNNEERMKRVLEGSLESTELNLDNLLKRRSFDHARWTSTKQLNDAVLNSDAVLADGVTKFSTKIDDVVANNKGEMEKLKKELQDQGGKMSVFEVKRKTLDEVTGDLKDEVIGAYTLPTEVVEHLARGDAAWSQPNVITKFLDWSEAFTSPWRGWATLSPGYHVRNYQGMLFMNYLRGVGAKEVKIPLDKIGLKKKGLSFTNPFNAAGMALRHAQALKVQMALEGVGELPLSVGIQFNKLAKKAGYKNFDAVGMPEMKLPGMKKKGKVTASQIAKLAQEYDVPQTIAIGQGKTTGVSKLIDPDDPFSASDAIQFAWRGAQKTVNPKKLDEFEDLDPMTVAAFESTQQASKTVGQKADWLLGSNNVAIKANRALATIPENNGRLAMFIDRLVKGDTLDDAALETKKWHFDYRKLSQVEKKLFAAAMPFYAWTRFAMPRMIMSVVESPGRVAALPKSQEMLKNWAEDEGIPTGMAEPDYYDEVQATQIPYMDEDGYPVFITADLPILEINKMNARDVLSSMNPLPKTIYEWTTGEQLFTGTPIERYPGEEDRSVRWEAPGALKPMSDYVWKKLGFKKAPKMSRFARSAIRNIAPPIDRYLLRPQEFEAQESQPNRTGYWWLSTFGLTARPHDLRRIIRGKNFQDVQMIRNYEKLLEQTEERAKEEREPVENWDEYMDEIEGRPSKKLGDSP